MNKNKNIETAHPLYRNAMCGGITKREYYASLILSSALNYYGFTRFGPAEVSVLAVEYADALILELNQ